MVHPRTYRHLTSDEIEIKCLSITEFKKKLVATAESTKIPDPDGNLMSQLEFAQVDTLISRTLWGHKIHKLLVL